MQTFLTNATLFTVIAFACLMILDFILGLVHLAKSSQSPQPPQTRVEDVFKIIDSRSEESPKTEDAIPYGTPSLNALSPIPAPQFSTVGSQAVDYEAMTIRELKGLASSLKVPYYSRKRKAELIEAIRR